MSTNKVNLFEQVFGYYVGTKAGIEALIGVQEGSAGYATDTNELGSYDGTTWTWGQGGTFDLAAAIHGATAETTLADADEFGFWKSVGSVLRKITWANIKTVLNSLYALIKHAHQLGSEELTNTGFDTDLSGWTAGAGWAWEAGGRARHTTGNTAELTQSGTLLENEYYKVSITIGALTAGQVNVTMDAGDDIAVSSNGTTNLLVKWNNGSGLKIRLRPTTDFDGYVDAVSVKQMAYVQDVLGSSTYGRTNGSWQTLGNSAVKNVGTASTDVAAGDRGVTNGDTHDHNGGDGGAIAYSSLSGALTQAAGTWSPTGVAVANVDAIVDHTANYLRLGSMVHCFGRIEINPTALATTRVRIDLPIASNFANAEECVGTISDGAGGNGVVLADATNNEAEFFFTAASTSNRNYYYMFTYQII